MQLSERKDKILRWAVEDYISDALPITSSVVQEKHLSDISSATLRNELNALEAMGYLKQLHVSGGRVPTTEGYKYYVSRLLQSEEISNKKLDLVKSSISNRTSSISQIISEIANIVSRQTNLPTVVFMSGYQKLVIEQITIVQLIESDLLLLIKTKDGVVHTNINSKATAKSCEDASYYLTKKFKGQTIGNLIETIKNNQISLKEELIGFSSIVKSMVEFLENLIENGTMALRRDGSAKLLEDAKNDKDETQNLFNLLEDETELKNSLSVGENDREITCEIADMGDKKGCAIIKAPLIVGGKQIASVGVVGLKRMDYASIASVLKFVMDEMEDMNITKLTKGDG